MTKWKQPSNGITAVIAPRGSFPALPPPLLGSGEPSSVFLWPFMCLSPSTVQYRYAKLDQPSQFGGQPCNFHGREEEACDVSARYTCNNVPVCEGFLCSQTGISYTPIHMCSALLSGKPYSIIKCLIIQPHSSNTGRLDVLKIQVTRRRTLIISVRCEWVIASSHSGYFAF